MSVLFERFARSGLRSIFRRLPVGESKRQWLKAIVRDWFPRLSTLREGIQARGVDLVPRWNGDWSTLFPALDPVSHRILVIDWKPPAPDRDSGSFRMRMILDLMCESGWQVDFIGDVHGEARSYARLLVESGIRVVVGREAAWNHLTRYGGAYRTVWISRPEIAECYLPMIRALSVQARLVYDTVDLHWVRLQRGVPFSDNPEELRAASDDYRRIELCNAKCSDLTVAITEDEKEILLSELPGLKVAVVPNIHPVRAGVAPVSARTDLFFIGSFNHPPNVDAVHYFVRDILPMIAEELPAIRFCVAGSDMPHSIWSLRSKWVNPVGYVPDVGPWFDRCRVFVAPLRHGAGMKGKVGQSLAHGLPVVATSVGAEGMNLSHGSDAMISDNPESFADSVLRVYLDDELWLRLSSSGQELVRLRYSKEAVSRVLLPLLGSASPAGVSRA